MKCSIKKRGENSWRLKFDLPRENGERRTQYVTVQANGKKEAREKLAALIPPSAAVPTSNLPRQPWPISWPVVSTSGKPPAICRLGRLLAIARY